MSDAGLIQRLQQQVADRDPIDWNAVEQQPLTADEAEQVMMLRLLDAVGAAHNAFQTADEFADFPAPAPVIQPLDDAEAWGRYRLDEEIGRGGFGSVYRAWDPELEMPVAIKILHGSQSLLPEARLLARLRHPNVVRVLTVQQHDGRYGLVMELLHGQTLDHRLAIGGPLTEEETLAVGADVCRALVAVHAIEVIHRDVKARNIMREESGRVVLMDFGTGLDADSDDGRMVGTLPYMAPELLQGLPATVRSDVYAVGVLLFYLVTGHHPHAGRNADDFRAAHARGVVPRLREMRPATSAAFARVVDSALALDPRQRPQTSAMLLQALEGARRIHPAWRQRAWQLTLAALVLLAATTAAGMLSSGAFNLTLGRDEVSTESFAEWFRLGRRSLLMPVVLIAMVLWLVGLAAAVRRVLVTSSTLMHSVDALAGRACGRVASGMSLHDPGISSCWLILLSTGACAAVWTYWSPLIAAAVTSATTAPAEQLAVLSPAFADFHTAYRMALTVVAAANLVLWQFLVRSTRTRGVSLQPWVKWVELFVVVLLLGSMQLPYRLVYDNDEFPVVRWQEHKCYEMGTKGAEKLLFCPSYMPRNRTVPEAEVERTGDRESMFSDFSPAALR